MSRVERKETHEYGFDHSKRELPEDPQEEVGEDEEIPHNDDYEKGLGIHSGPRRGLSYRYDFGQQFYR